MPASLRKLERHANNAPAQYAQPCIGRIVEVLPDGRAKVTFAGCAAQALPARSVMGSSGAQDPAPSAGSSVLILFEDGDMEKPIIAGVVRDALPVAKQREIQADNLGGPEFAVLDRRRVVLEASQEITLQCGRGSLTLTADGRIVIRGTDIVSRASGTNKIKGAAVNIN
jgi:hypothetical protein